MSWIPTTAPAFIASRHASSRSFSVNGSPTCTVGRRSAAESSNAADAGGRALERLDERGVIVALDLEDHGPAVTDVDRTRVLTGPLEHARPLGGKPAQVGARVLVGAVLRPERREEPELGVGRLAAEAARDPV